MKSCLEESAYSHYDGMKLERKDLRARINWRESNVEGIAMERSRDIGKKLQVKSSFISMTCFVCLW